MEIEIVLSGHQEKFFREIPFSLILCAEILSRLFDQQQDVNEIKICKNASAISHLFYANDILLACRANRKNVVVVASCLKVWHLVWAVDEFGES